MASPDCTAYADSATSMVLPPSLWVPPENDFSAITGTARVCLSFPFIYVATCCSEAGAPNGVADSQRPTYHGQLCNWPVCVSNTTDAQWADCFERKHAEAFSADATHPPPVTWGNGTYSYKCATLDEIKAAASSGAGVSKWGARRAVVGASVLAMACAVLVAV